LIGEIHVALPILQAAEQENEAMNIRNWALAIGLIHLKCDALEVL
jgi:hypothetical protein